MFDKKSKIHDSTSLEKTKLSHVSPRVNVRLYQKSKTAACTQAPWSISFKFWNLIQKIQHYIFIILYSKHRWLGGCMQLLLIRSCYSQIYRYKNVNSISVSAYDGCDQTPKSPVVSKPQMGAYVLL